MVPCHLQIIKFYFFSNLNTFYFFFLPNGWWLWLPVLCWIKLARMGISVLFLNKTFIFSTLSMMSAVGFLIYGLFMFRYILSIPTFLHGDDQLIFILHFVYITLIDFQMLNHSCIPERNAAWFWCIILLMCCWIQFANILLRIF